MSLLREFRKYSATSPRRPKERFRADRTDHYDGILIPVAIVGYALLVMRRILASVVCVAVVGSVGCATYLDDLNRAEKHYQANEHERALALFRVIEPDVDSLSHADRTRYAYLRGINNYRMSGQAEGQALTDVDKAYRAHARHWLALARSLERMKPGGLRPAWEKNIEEALRDLNQDTYGVGVFPEEPVEPGAKPPTAPPSGAEATNGDTADDAEKDAPTKNEAGSDGTSSEAPGL